MRVHWRTLRPGELDHELIWLAVTTSGAALAFAWLTIGLPWPTCAFRSLTGLPCMTCGATRAALALAHGDFLGAWRLNPLAVVAIGGIAVFDVYALAVLAMRRRRLRVSVPRRATRWLLLVGAASALVNWAYVLGSN